MAERQKVSSYVLNFTGGPSRSGPKLVPYNEDKGTHFKVYLNSEDQKWHWDLHLNSSPQGLAARSGRGYSTKQGAKGSIETALKAFTP